MKILVMDKIRPHVNSASAIHRWELIKNLADCDCDVFVLSYSDLQCKKIHVAVLKDETDLFSKILSQFGYLSKLFSLPYKHNIDVLYTRNELIGFVGLFIKILTGSKLVIEVNGISSDEWNTIKAHSNNKILTNLKIYFLLGIGSYVMKKADALVAVTEGIKKYLIDQGITESKVFVVENGANVDLFKPINDSKIINKLRGQHGIAEDDHVLLFVGNFAPWQGVEYLIKVAPLVLKKVPQTKFVIVGDGIMRKQWEDMVQNLELKDYFVFPGKIPYENVSLYINMSDTCIVLKKPLDSGYSPLKLYEYMACEKPIVASKVTGFEILEQYNAGILVNPLDAQEVCKAIFRLLKNEQLRKQMGMNGRNLVISKYSWRITAVKTLDVFKNIVNKRG